MITSNVLRVAAINSIGDFVLFLGKVLVVISTVLLGFKLLEVKLIIIIKIGLIIVYLVNR